MKSIRLMCFCICLLTVSQLAAAAEYTRFGAKHDGNQTGDIPPFEGRDGLVCPGDYEKGNFLPDPYKKESPPLILSHEDKSSREREIEKGRACSPLREIIWAFN